MGDVIHTLVAVTALRQAFPVAFIGWVIEERWAELLCTPPEPQSGPRSPRRPLVDKVHTVNTRAWRRSLLSPRTRREIAGSFSDLRSAPYDVAVDFQGAFRSSFIARLSAAPIVYGFAEPRENIASLFYTRKVMASGSHIIEQNLSLAAAVVKQALPLQNVEFPRDQAEGKTLSRLLADNGLNQFVMLNPGAGWAAKQWPAERYGAVAKQLAETVGLRAIVNFGPGEEGLAREVERTSCGSALAMSLSLTELVALTRNASLFIGGDTGPMHLAAALGVPVVGIFGPTSPERNGPFATRHIVLRSALSPTTHTRSSKPDEAMLTITSDHVVAAALTLLGN
jgi:heptosyltransferase I